MVMSKLKTINVPFAVQRLPTCNSATTRLCFKAGLNKEAMSIDISYCTRSLFISHMLHWGSGAVLVLNVYMIYLSLNW